MQRIFIADPSLADHRGHHFGLTDTISDNCVEQGLETIWLTHKRFDRSTDNLQSNQVHLTFSNATYDGHRSMRVDTNCADEDHGNRAGPREYLRSIYRRIPIRVRGKLTPMVRNFLAALGYPSGGSSSVEMQLPVDESLQRGQELNQALEHFDSGPEDIVLFHTCDAETYRDVLSFFSNTAQVTEWNTLPVFHLSTPYDEETMPHNRRILSFEHSIRRLKNLGLIGTRIFLHAENELLANHLSTYLDLKVSPLAIPPFKSLTADDRPAASARTNVMYLGPARSEKGFAELPTIVEECLLRGLDVHFTVQITPQILGYTPDVEHAVGRLKSIDDGRLRLLDTPLSQEAYKSTVATADIILLCYDASRYAVRSSGIAVEAILSEATIVTTRNTFPAYIAGNSGVHVAGPSEIPDAIAFICSNLKQFRSRAHARKQWYLDNHGGKKFVDNITHPKGIEIESSIVPGLHKYADKTVWKELICNRTAS